MHVNAHVCRDSIALTFNGMRATYEFHQLQGDIFIAAYWIAGTKIYK